MRPRARPLTAMLAVVSLLLAGCASTANMGGQSSSYVSPLQAQADDFRVTVAQGAIAGALIGGVIGAVTGGGDMRRIVAGAAAGGAVGAIGGYAIAGQKQAYANKEQALESLMADARQRNDKLARVLATTDQLIAKRKEELAKLKAANVAAAEKAQLQRALLQQLESDQRAIDQIVVSAQDHAKELDQNIAQLRQQFPDASVRPLEDLSVGFQKNRKEFERRPDEIRQIMSSVSTVKVT